MFCLWSLKSEMNCALIQMLCQYNFCVNFKPNQGPTDKTKEPDPVGSDQLNVGIQVTNRKSGLNYCISNISSSTA